MIIPGILLILIACILMAISLLSLIFSVLIAGTGLVALFFSFDRALVILKHY
jgi:uncharacterized membrane protein